MTTPSKLVSIVEGIPLEASAPGPGSAVTTGTAGDVQWSVLKLVGQIEGGNCQYDIDIVKDGVAGKITSEDGWASTGWLGDHELDQDTVDNLFLSIFNAYATANGNSPEQIQSWLDADASIGEDGKIFEDDGLDPA